ncbi:P-loop containing nucleoside triphosphate hydrolase protein, partial [Gyrodon lividus]
MMSTALQLSRSIVHTGRNVSSCCIHTSSVLLAGGRRAARGSTKPVSSSKTRLSKSIQPTGKAKKLGSLHVAPTTSSSFTRDAAPHSGRTPKESSVPAQRKSSLISSLPVKPQKKDTTSPSAEKKHFAILAHSERAERRAASRQPSSNPLEEQFDLSASSSHTDALPSDFTSPPLLPGLLRSLRETLGENATPTAIQALSLKHLFKQPESETKWKEYLLASETGSGKSIAYLLPLLQDLKRTELQGSPSPRTSLSRSLNPRALILAPTHELSRQLAGFAKKLSHVIKLRVMCASRANTQSNTRNSGTASKMKVTMKDISDNGESGEMTISSGGRSSHEADLLVGTPMKLLELERGRGWNWEQRARERASRISAKSAEDPETTQEQADSSRKFWVDEPEMSLENIEWVIVDEADVLFDPDFEESTRKLLADIASARGQPVPVLPASLLSPLQDTRPTPDSPQPISYPFNFLLTSATIPNSLSDYLSSYHPTLTRLASPKLHHLPSTLRTEHAKWTGGNKDADIERRIRRVWAEDALAHAKSALPGTGPVKLSKTIVFCNKRSKVEQLSAFLGSRGISCVALTGDATSRKRGNNHHLDGFLKSTDPSSTTLASQAGARAPKAGSSNPAVTPHVLITTSLLSRGLDFSPDIKHVFIVDEPRNMIDFLHRAGRAGRAGEAGNVVVFGRAEGRGSGRTDNMRKRVRALVA